VSCETVEHLLDFVDERTTRLALTVVKRAFVWTQQAIVDLIMHSTNCQLALVDRGFVRR
jgi:uncharacterized protein with FMN-binding domain